MIFFYCVSGMADNCDPIKRTNVNKQTDLLQESVPNWQQEADEAAEDRKTRLQNLSVGTVPSMIKGQAEHDENKSVEGNADTVAQMSYEEVESQGRNKIFADNIIDELYVDYTKPLYKAYLEDAKDLARKQDDFMKNHLTAQLKALDIDCKTIKGDKLVEPEFYLETANKPEEAHLRGSGRGDTRYNQTICEFLRNQYQCHDELTMQCRRFSEKEFESVKFGSSDIGYNYSTYGGVSNYYFDTDCVGTICVHRGKQPHVLKRMLGKRKKHKLAHKVESEEFAIYFDINDDIEVINRLELTDINYNGVMSISLNGNNIGVLPIGGSSLNIVDTHTMKSGKKGKYRQTYSVINNGFIGYVLTPVWDTGDSGRYIQHVLGRQSYWYLNLKDYVRRGHNELRIKLVSLNGYIRFNFRISERICLEWQEIWDEKCQLK